MSEDQRQSKGEGKAGEAKGAATPNPQAGAGGQVKQGAAGPGGTSAPKSRDDGPKMGYAVEDETIE
jgi:hypothetical protein